jgi:archaemetzincin
VETTSRPVKTSTAAWIRLACYLLAGGLAAWAIVTRRYTPPPSETFTPPNAEQRRAAIGPVVGLPPVLQRAFSEEGFEPIPQPRDGDWLDCYTEFGQPYERFARSHAPLAPERNRLYLQPLGHFASGEGPPLEKLREFAQAFFGLEVKRLPIAEVPDDGFPSRIRADTGHRQWLVESVADWLAERLPGDACVMVGVTSMDLCPAGSWNCVYGQAGLRERIAVFSFARFHPRFFGDPPEPDSDRQQLRKSCQVLVHESCHQLGLVHCIYYRCLMNGANHLGELEAQPLHLCPVCLRKLHAMIGFDVCQRYGRLLDFSRHAGFDGEAAWLARRCDQFEHP